MVLAIPMLGVVAFAEENNTSLDNINESDSTTIVNDELTVDEMIEEIMKDEDFINSDDFISKELIDELTSDKPEIQDMEHELINGNEIAHPEWNTGIDDDKIGHYDIATTVRKCLGDGYSEDDKDKLMICITYGAYKADNQDLHHRIGDEVKGKTFYPNNKLKISNGKKYYKDNAVQLHAVTAYKYKDKNNNPYANYLKSLKYLWKYAKLSNKVKYKNGVYDDEDLNFDIFNSLNVDGDNNEIDDIEDLENTTKYIFYHYADKMKLNRALTNDEKKFLVIGLAIHLIGDTYAHRAVVPTNFSNDSLYTSKIKSIGGKYIKNEDGLKKAIKKGDFYCTKFSTYLDESKLKNDDKSANSIFEDNDKFMHERYHYSEVSSQNFVTSILKEGGKFSYTIVVNNKPYKDSDSSIRYINLYNYNIYKNNL